MLDAVCDGPRITRDDLRSLTPVTGAEGIPPPDRIWSDQDCFSSSAANKSADMDDRWDGIVEGQRLYLIEAGRVVASMRRSSAGCPMAGRSPLRW
jgi:hypothetical protein